MMPNLLPWKWGVATGAIIFVLAMLGYHLLGDKREHIARLAAEASLISYKTQQKVLTDAAIIENAENEAASKLKVEQAVQVSEALLKKFNLANVDRNQLTEKVRVLNASINQNEAVAARTRANINDSVRLSASRDSTAASEKSSTTRQLSAADSDASTLRQACRLTTDDLIKAYAYIDADTLACGREQ